MRNKNSDNLTLETVPPLGGLGVAEGVVLVALEAGGGVGEPDGTPPGGRVAVPVPPYPAAPVYPDHGAGPGGL